MTDIQYKILNFLLTAAVYSETAICKHLGLEEDEVQTELQAMKAMGYLEDYDDYLKREQLNQQRCSSGGCGGSCSSCSSGGCGVQNQADDYSNILVLTEKAMEEWYEKGAIES